MQIQIVHDIVDNATRLGGKTPASIAALLENWNSANMAADQIRPASFDALADQIATATPKTMGKLIETAASQSVIADRARDIVRSIQGHISHRLVQALRTGAGDELIGSLRPAFDAAAHAITECAFSPDTARQPARVIDLGDDAVRALRELPNHAAVLDGIFRKVMQPIASQLDLLPDPLECPPGARFVALVIDANHNANLYNAAMTFNAAQGSGEPGGSWHRLSSSGYKLRLNSPGEAATLIEQWNAEVTKRNQRSTAQAEEATAKLRSRMAGAR